MVPIDDCQRNNSASPTILRQIWPDTIHTLCGRDVQADAIKNKIQLAQDAVHLLLQAVKRLCVPSPRDKTFSASSEQSAAPLCQVHMDGVGDASIVADVAWAAQHALGVTGANCCLHLSENADWACAWLDVQLKLVQAILTLTIGTAGGAWGRPGPLRSPQLPPLLPLWSSLKGVSGLHSPLPDIRMASVQLLREALLARNAISTSAADTLMESRPVDAALRTHAVAEPNAGRQGVNAREMLRRKFEGDDMETGGAVPVAAGGGGGGGGSGGRGGDVSVWTVCREFTCNLAATDNDPRVVAAALRAAAALLLLCRDQCSAREWRQLAEGVLTAAGRAKSGEVWSAAEAFTKEHHSHPGWRAALRNLRATLRAAAAEPEGPLLGAATSSVNLCTVFAMAAALDATAAGPAVATCPLLQGGTDGEVDGNVAAEAKPGPGAEMMDLLLSLAACISDAARHGGWVSEPVAVAGPELPFANIAPSDSGADLPQRVASGQRKRQLEIQRWAFRGVVAVAIAYRSGGNRSGDDATATGAAGSHPWKVPAQAKEASLDAVAEDVKEDGVSAEQACALAAAAQAACCSLGCSLTPAGALEVLEALVSGAEAAPLALRSTLQRGDSATGDGSDLQHQELCSKPGGKLAVSRAGLLTAAASVALGAWGKLSLSVGSHVAATAASATAATATANGQGTAQVTDSWGVAPEGGAEGTAVLQMDTAVRVAKLQRRVANLVQDPEKLLFSEPGGAPSTPTAPALAAAARQHDMAVATGLQFIRTLLLAALPAPLVVASVVAQYDGTGSGGGDDTKKEVEGGAYAAHDARGPSTHASVGSGIPLEVIGGGGGRGQENLDAAGGAPSHSQSGSRRKPNVIIEELPDSSSSDGNGSPGASRELARRVVSEWRQQQQALVPELVLLCATYAPVRSAAAATVADSGLPMPPTDLFTPWAGVSDGVGTTAEALLAALHRRVHPQPAPSRILRGTAAAAAGAASLALMPADLVSEQDTLAACLPVLLRERIRPIVVQRHVQSLEEGPIRPYTGPDTFTRAVAGRRLAWLLLRSRHPFVGEALRTSLPAVLACCDDPAPGVVQYGVAALHTAAAECLAADLTWQRELLIEQARRLVVGCQEVIWPLACPAAVAIVRRIEGKDPRAVGYHRLTSDLLTEIERQAHVPVRRLTFMPAFGHLLAGLGLTSLRYTCRLMPLLLDWLHAHDARTRAAALQLLATVLRATWPRVAAHAGVLWRHMLVVLMRVAPGETGTGPIRGERLWEDIRHGGEGSEPSGSRGSEAQLEGETRG
ncbi:hypothetical protein VaNZ11_002620, partial [Volvox africanus]